MSRCYSLLLVAVATPPGLVGDRSTRLPFALFVTPIGVGAH